jgi:hypothetical protein
MKWWSIEWQQKSNPDAGPRHIEVPADEARAQYVGWDRVLARTAEDARARYEKEHPLRQVRAVSMIPEPE